MRPSPTLSTVAVGVFSSLTALAQPPPTTETARELRARAADHFTHEEYGDSYEASAAAYRLEHDPRDACNAGTTARAAADKAAPAEREEREKRLVDAATFLDLCIEAQPNVALDDAERARRAKLSAELEMVRQRIGALDIAADEGAEVQAGGKLLGRAPLARPVFIAPGTYAITATRQGRTNTRSITVAADTRLGVDVRSFAPVAFRSEAPMRPTPPPAQPRPLAGLVTVGTIVTGIAAGVGLVALVSSRVMYANGDAYERKAREESTVYPCDFPKPSQACKDMHEARVIAGTLQDTAVGAFVTAGIAGAATITVYLIDRPSSARPPSGAVLAVRGAF